MQIVTITRDKLYPVPGRSYRFAWKWLYSYAIDNASAVEYGTDLASLKGMLRRKYPQARLITVWS